MSKKLKSKADRTIRDELKRIRVAMRRPDKVYNPGYGLTYGQQRELYGAQQALMWARGEDRMAPCRCALLRKRVK